MDVQERQNSLNTDFKFNAQHNTLMLVISADGHLLKSVVILCGTSEKYRTRADGSIEVPNDYFSFGALVSYRKPASMSVDKFSKWADHYVE